MKGTVILYLNGVEFGFEIYTSKHERESIIAKWREKHGNAMSAVGIIPRIEIEPKEKQPILAFSMPRGTKPKEDDYSGQIKAGGGKTTILQRYLK